MIQTITQERTFGMTGCQWCVCLKPCGGHPLPIVNKLGCSNYANRHHIINTGDMDPHFPDSFWRWWNDVGGLLDYNIGPLKPMLSPLLPRYIPQIQNKHLKCAAHINSKVVAIPLFAILKMKNGVYGPRYDTAKSLRNAFSLAHDTEVILIGVDVDAPIEQFWARHRLGRPLETLRNLNLLGVTVPNFSFFTDVTRFQIMRNRKRILLAAERLSQAGLKVAPHFNALTVADWSFWVNFLTDHPEVDVVTMEFQTGYRADENVGKRAFASLVDLQERVGRSIHPILVGAGRYYKAASEEFLNFSIVDSQPFMRALQRERLLEISPGYFEWVKTMTAPGAPLDEFINSTLESYERKLSADDIRVRSEDRDPLQTDWGWGFQPRT